jgi:hypothetical protein
LDVLKSRFGIQLLPAFTAWVDGTGALWLQIIECVGRAGRNAHDS